jgi:hypothetical protein
MFNLNVTHFGLLKVHMCGRISCRKQIRWKSKTLKVRPRFMFHYRTLPERRLKPQRSSTALRASESAVFDRNKSRTLPDKLSITLTALDDEGKCSQKLACAAK